MAADHIWTGLQIGFGSILAWLLFVALYLLAVYVDRVRRIRRGEDVR